MKIFHLTDTIELHTLPSHAKIESKIGDLSCFISKQFKTSPGTGLPIYKEASMGYITLLR